jgi:predicted nucleic acid-binding protein
VTDRVYIDTSVLVSAFSNEPQQVVAMALLQDPHWEQVCVSDWTVAEFTCALQAKVLRGETPPEVAHTIGETLKNLIAQGALHRIAVLREDYAAVQRTVPSLNCLVRGADALHLAVAARSNITHFASLDKTQRVAAEQWLVGVDCVPQA